MKYHPDRNPDDPTAEQNFKEVNEAMTSKDGQRAAYDRFATTLLKMAAAAAVLASAALAVLRRYFRQVGEFMGGRGQRQSAARFALQHGDQLEDAFNGRQREVDIPPRWCARNATAAAPPVGPA